MGRKWLIIIVIVTLGIATDQVSKWCIQNFINLPYPLIRGFFELRLRHNPGSAFGIKILSTPQLLVITVAVTVVFLLFFALDKAGNPKNQRLFTWGASFYISGAWGNLIDRLRLGYVVDFFYTPFWATFNLADVLIVLGMGLILLGFLYRGKDEEAEDSGL
ncbi:signal peptidase II [Thermatribacter velox]|jgi:signal peptidase II|uniref:Lipoprotein signal peptidase n=1 Tax=Thermatribacter velox TaxID=3039681 RepID=A0ABZ2Y824_9BACT